jgi:hypothetical protein
MREFKEARGASCCVALLGLCGAVSAAPPMFDIQVLPVTPAPFRFTTAADIGPSGEVVGRFADFNVTPALVQGFVYRDGVFTLLPPLSGSAGTDATCVDRAGVIYGGSLDPRFQSRFAQMHAVRWVNGIPESLGDRVNTNGNIVRGCAPTSGAVVGVLRPFAVGDLGWRGEYGYDQEFDFGNNDPSRAAIWSGGTHRMLPGSGGISGDFAIDINDAGYVTLNRNSPDRVTPALFHPQFGILSLPSLGGGSASIGRINAHNVAIGSALGPGALDRPVKWELGRCVDLGLLPGQLEGRARDINDAGVIVGGMAAAPFDFGVQPTTGTIWIDGQWHDLNLLIPPGSGFTIHDAVAINESMQILVTQRDLLNVTNARFAVLTPRP